MSRCRFCFPTLTTTIMQAASAWDGLYAVRYATDKQCQDYAEWMLKRVSVLQKAVSISCGQIFHLMENELVEIVRTDKENSPVERHLIMGFSRPIAGTGEMTIDAVSVNDMVMATAENI